MKRGDWWCGVALVALAILFHAAIPRYELLAPSPTQSHPADVPYGDFYGAARYPTLIRLDRWTGAVETGSLVGQIEAPPTWVWVRLDKSN